MEEIRILEAKTISPDSSNSLYAGGRYTMLGRTGAPLDEGFSLRAFHLLRGAIHWHPMTDSWLQCESHSNFVNPKKGKTKGCTGAG